MDELRRAIDEAVESGRPSNVKVEYDLPVETAIAALSEAAAEIAARRAVDPRWLAVKLLEGDELAAEIADGKLDALLEEHAEKIRRHTGDDPDVAVADGRYGFIHGLAKDVINRSEQIARTMTDSIDKIVLNRLLGLPIFFLVMYLMFSLTMNIGAPFIAFFDRLCGTVFVDGFGRLLESWGTPGLLNAFLADGIGGGVQTVATFIPPIALIFLFLSILEDSGYMARASFVMDRFLRAIGLPGKAFIPMLVGLGCNVPGILATRTLESRRDRILSILINPLISCGARLPVYALFAAAFFKQDAAIMLFGIYATGIVLAVLMGLLFGKTILQGEASTFVMELPPYHVPTVNGVLFHTWFRLKSFVLRAGKTIVLVVAVLGILSAVGPDGSLSKGDPGKSVLGALGKEATPAFRPMGITDDNWPAVVALFSGIFAKEAVVGTINSLYSMKTDANTAPFDFWGGVGNAFKAIPDGFKGFWKAMFDPLGLSGAVEVADAGSAGAMGVGDDVLTELRNKFPNRSAVVAYLLFVLIYVPCVSVIAAIAREAGWGWAAFSVAYLTGLAWVVATMFYQATRLSSEPVSALVWLAVCAGALGAFVATLKLVGRLRLQPSL
jgi:ferrous iron transport protein B